MVINIEEKKLLYEKYKMDGMKHIDAIKRIDYLENYLEIEKSKDDDNERKFRKMFKTLCRRGEK